MGIFTKEVSLPASKWLRAISYARTDAIARISASCPYRPYFNEVADLVKILGIFIDNEEELKYIASSNPDKLYSIRFPRRLLSLLTMLTLRRLSEGEMREVQAGGPRMVPPGGFQDDVG
jgi:hypothetical protein